MSSLNQPESCVYDRACEAAAAMASRTSLQPTVAVVLGSGLGGFASQLDNPEVIPYSDIPYFAQPTAIGHTGRLVIGTLDGVPVAVMVSRLASNDAPVPCISWLALLIT